MDDLISRQDAIDLVRDVCDAILSECGCHYDSEVEDEVYDDIHEVSTILKCNKAIRKSLMDLPSAQTEIIRCKDCKYQRKGQNECEAWNLCGYRPWQYTPITDEHFCSYAEREENA